MSKNVDIDLSDFEGSAGKPLCKLARIQAELIPERQQSLQVALEKKNGNEYSISVERIVEALRGWGYSVSVTSVRTHRRQVCACAR